MSKEVFMLSCVFMVCATVVLIVSSLTKTVIPDGIISTGILAASAMISYFFGTKQNNTNDKNNKNGGQQQ